MKKLIILILILPYILVANAQDVQGLLRNYLDNYQYQKALDLIQTLEPSKEILITKSHCYKAIRNYQKAIDILKPLAEEYKEDIQIKIELATCYEATAKRETAIDCYDDLIRLDSTNIYFKLQKADILYQNGKYEKALNIFKHISDQNNPISTLKRSAQCFEKMNMPDSAMLYFKSAWQRDSTDAFSAANLINLCLKNKRMTEALAYSDKYMESDTTDHQINLLNALSYYSMDLYEEAIPKFKKCYQNGDSSVIVNRSIGLSYYSLNDSYEAQPYLENAFRQDSINNNVLYCLAVATNDMAEHAKAIPLFRKLLDRTIPPDFTLYLYYKNLASAYDKGSLFQEAADSYLQALKYAGTNQKMTLYFTIGNLYEYSLNNEKEALIYFDLYRNSLSDYLEKIEKKDDTEPSEVKEIKLKIRNLNEHIDILKKRTLK